MFQMTSKFQTLFYFEGRFCKSLVNGARHGLLKVEQKEQKNTYDLTFCS